ncbi:MAG: NADP-dependent glyceraldehyde-3-phosphate dehydrogenase [cyanobacterium endosymbiont of Epithemia adnata isolate EadnSB Bon19]|uniref:NADP-dependent glyceraldehyde-3-phosphate dehydrogenase n=1 Tax=cyanobacterium endosymbiont of Epithemia turgida TaxID=718217 RepID=UPI0004D0C687|nr:NADP-dependent glyceraldehyde-3-phosphate dehydrogenase [cyanobacterium endosymbiont of Epithemia turgida]BAP17057.1 aldehyde dehydrogenase [cyanobacterium endosymbiont of Epithemia turgida isolate EtSB Lake Yunoko]
MSIFAKINNIFPSLENIPPEFYLENSIEQREYLINGKLEIWNGEMEESLSPIYLKTPQGLTRKKIGDFPCLGEEAALSALDAAAKAYDNGRGKWPTMPVGQRIECLQDFAYRMKEKRAEVVNLLMWEIGKSYTDSCKEFDRTVDYIEDTIDALKNLDRVSSRFEITQGVIGQIRRAPLGIVLSMGPANYPLNETFTTLIPALIMGNTVVVKAPRPGVLLNYPLLEAFKEAFPPGVVNTIYGKGRTISLALMESGKIDALAFIGSSQAANNLKKQHPKSYRLRSILGLEAKNPGIILPHADLDLTVKECILGTLSYNGQRCTAIKILFVHTAIIDKFLDKFIEAISNLKFGMPWEEGVFLTPIAERGKPQYLQDLVEDAKKHGADVINEAGGTINETFFYPAVLYPVNEQMKIYSVEQFGPVIPIVPFDDIETTIDYLVQSDYGQQVSIFGQNTEEIAQLVDPLVNQVCRVNLNSQCQRGPDSFPFTGRKDSAEGTLSVNDALRAFSIRTLVAAKEIDINKKLISEIVREHKSNFLSTDFIL